MGQPTLRTGSAPAGRPGGPAVFLEVADAGCGMAPDVVERVFDPFFTTKPPGSGTGLGLNVSHNIVVRKHGGQISVESRPGRTCFRVELPVTRSGADAVDGEEEA